MRVLPPLRFQFAEEDQPEYGDQWFEFDEAALWKLRARELMELDDVLRAELRLNALGVIQAFARGDARGSLGVMWLARRLAGIDEPLAEFNPLVAVAQTEVRKDTDPNPPAPTSSPSPESAEA